jgi:predicted membrane protein
MTPPPQTTGDPWGDPARTPLQPAPPSPVVDRTPGPFGPIEEERVVPVGRLVVGGLLVVAGIIWLLDATGVIDVSWGTLLPIALIIVGLAIMAGARTGRHPGLVALGVILTVVLAVVSSFDLPLVGGFGERVERPTSTSAIPDRYNLAVGSLRLDLTRLELPDGTTSIDARVGIGQMTVVVPVDATVVAEARVTAGQLQGFGEERSGISVEHTFQYEVGQAASTLRLDLSAGVGSITIELAP